jgi:hypothetical protein
MAPEEKAVYLVQLFIDEGFLPAAARIAALIAVEEIIELHKGMFMAERENQNESYWQEVKQEIENL